MMRRFYTLDALRGIAALTVFTAHAGPLAAPLNLAHAMLAVDLFFMLSGYVIDRAYADRLTQTLTPAQFMLARCIRLYPLYMLGSLIGALAAVVALLAGQGSFSPGTLATATLFASIMVPSPTWNASIWLMPLNFPTWSLAFELFANFFFAYSARFLTVRRLLALCGLSAAWLTHVAIEQNGLHDGFDWLHPEVGFPRVLFGFFAGVTIRRVSRERLIITRWAYFAPFSVLLLFADTGGGLGDAVKTIFLFPLLIVTAASIEPPKVRFFMALGILSYPLYTIHIPIIQLIERILTICLMEAKALAPWAGIILAIMLAIISLLLDRFFDQPVREWLSRKLLHPPKSGSGRQAT